MIESIEVLVTCDECGDDTRLEIVRTSFYNLDREIERLLNAENWHLGEKERGEWQCESCWDVWQAELEAKEKAESDGDE